MGGKCRNKIRVYQSPDGSTPEEIADNALALIEQYGYTALKMEPLPPDYHVKPWNAVLRETEKRVAAVRKAVGDDIDIGLDPHVSLSQGVPRSSVMS